jgi:hypothetical protein
MALQKSNSVHPEKKGFSGISSFGLILSFLKGTEFYMVHLKVNTPIPKNQKPHLRQGLKKEFTTNHERPFIVGGF